MMLGAFLFALDTTIVNLAIPKIMTSLSADLNQIQWVLIVYMIGMADLSDRRARRLDLLGLGTMATWVVTLLLALSRGNIEGWNSQYILSLFGVAGLFLVLFLVVEIYVREPLIDLHLYRNPTYATATLVGGLLSFGLYSSGLLVTLFLQDFLKFPDDIYDSVSF
jgi:MFS family permease